MNPKLPTDPSMASTDDDVRRIAESVPTFALVRCTNEQCGLAALLPEGVLVCPACQKGTMSDPFGFYDRRETGEERVVWQ